MVYLIYSFCFTLAFLLALPFFLIRAFWQKKYFSNFWQRLGFLPLELHSVAPGGIWIHGVSVGEVLSAVPLAKALKQRWPNRPLLISTTTVTGQKLAAQRLADIAKIFYFPFDWKFSVSQSLASLRPDIVLIVETEIWPNFLRTCRRLQVPVMLINGRISDRSIQRYSRIRWFMRKILADFDFFCMQSQVDLERILFLGAPREKAEVCGNLKYDMKPPGGIEQKLESYRQLFGLKNGSFLVVAGSTMKDEEELVLSAFRRLRKVCPRAVLLLAPRHPERFKEVEEMLAKQSYRFMKRSAQVATHPIGSGNTPEVILLDSMGELATLYALADVVFIGGSLVPKGGHNPLEPALFKKAILFGPSMSNFRETAEHFMQRNAALKVENEEALSEKLTELEQNRALRQVMGENGYSIIEASRGATERILQRTTVLLTERTGPKVKGEE